MCYWLVACSRYAEPQGIFENYLYRLANSLDVSHAENMSLGPKKLPRYPIKNQMTYDIPATSINLVEFLKLSPCDLQRHVGQRNSSLGRLMKPTQKLLYERQFITLAETCLQELESTSELAIVISDVLKNKYQQWPMVMWNAFFSSEEVVHLFSMSSRPLTSKELQENPTELYASLALLERVFSQKTHINSQEIENAYSIFASTKRIGELRLSMQLAYYYVDLAERLLSLRIENKPLCFKQRTNAQFEVVNTVFLKFYIGEVQPYLAALHQQASRTLQAVDRIVNVLNPKPEFKQFWAQIYTGNTSEWKHFDRTIKRHTRQWQTLLTQCGRLPS